MYILAAFSLMQSRQTELYLDDTLNLISSTIVIIFLLDLFSSHLQSKLDCTPGI